MAAAEGSNHIATTTTTAAATQGDNCRRVKELNPPVILSIPPVNAP